MSSNLSPRQYGTMRYVSHRDVTLDDLRGFHQITLWSLLKRGYLTKNSRGRLYLTHTGAEELLNYTSAKLSTRKVEADISDGVTRLLRHVRTIQMMRVAS